MPQIGKPRAQGMLRRMRILRAKEEIMLVRHGRTENDRRLLSRLRNDSQQLADELHMSASACWRRVSLPF